MKKFIRLYSISFIIFIACIISNPLKAQWKSLSTVGDRGQICVHENKIFVAGNSGSLWQSADLGESWQLTPNYFSKTSMTFTVISSKGNIYASRQAERIIKSTDDGETWTQVNNGIPTGDNFPVMLASGENIFTASSFYGVYKSSDDGASWHESNTGITDRKISAFGGKGDTIFAGTDSGKVYKSTNGGELWTDVSPSFTFNLRIYFTAVIDNSVYVGNSSFGEIGLVRSDDWGETWVQDNDGIDPILPLKTGGIVKADTFLFVGMYSGGIYKRSLNSSTWSNISSPVMLSRTPPDYPDSIYTNAIYMAAIGTTIFAQVPPAGVFRSTDMGLTWKQITNSAGDGFDNRGLAVHNGNLYLGGDGGILISSDNGNFWNTYFTNVFVGARISSYAFIDSFMFAGQMNLGVGMLRSSDGGKFWVKKNNGLTAGGAKNINKMAVIDSILFAGTSAGIYYSADKGESWTATAYPAEYINELHAHGSTLFAFSQFILSRSTDMGQTWAPITNGIDPWDWVDVISSGNRLLLAGAGIRTSTDDGVSWSDITGNMSPIQFYAIATSGDTIFAASAFNCYYTTNLGESWTIITNEGFPLIPSFRNIIAYGGYIYAGMGESGNLGGAWKIPYPGTTSVEQVNADIPVEFELRQNYPNPFNPSTTIEFRIPESGMVELKIFDILGREVSTLVNQQMNSGNYKVTWHVAGMPTGVYFSRLVMNEVSMIKQMLLIK